MGSNPRGAPHGESRGSRNSIGSGPRYEVWAPLGAQTSSLNSLTQLASQLAQSRIHPPKGPQVREGGRTHAVRFLQSTPGLSKSHRGSSQATFPRAPGRRVLKAWPRDYRLLLTWGPRALRPGIPRRRTKRPPAVHQGEAGPSYAASEIGVPTIPKCCRQGNGLAVISVCKNYREPRRLRRSC